MRKIQRIALYLQKRVALEFRSANLVLQHKHQPIRDDYGVGTATHSGNGELQKQVRVRQLAAECLQMCDLNSPSAGLRLDHIERAIGRQPSEHRLRVRCRQRSSRAVPPCP